MARTFNEDKKIYTALIITTFQKVVEIEANSQDEALELVENMVDTGDVDTCDTSDFWHETMIIKEESKED